MAFNINRREPLSLHLLMFTTVLLHCGSWKISHVLHCTKETFPNRLNESKSGCLRKLKTLYLPHRPFLVGFSMLITSGSIIHLKRFGSDMRLTTFDFVQCLRPDREWEWPSDIYDQIVNGLLVGGLLVGGLIKTKYGGGAVALWNSAFWIVSSLESTSEKISLAVDSFTREKACNSKIKTLSTT